MSSRKQATTSAKNASGRKGAARGASGAAEPTREEKAAFVKAMWKGIEPGSEAARTTEAKRGGAAGKPASGKSAPAKTAAAKPSGKAAAKAGSKAGSKTGTKSAAKKTSAKKTSAKKTAATREPAEKQPEVEVLRKISAQEQPELTPVSQSAVRLALDMERALRNGDTDFIQPEAVQALMAALVRTYAAQDEAGNQYPVVGGRMVLTGTDVMIVCGALLKAVDLQVFELGMWQSWSGR